MKLRQVEAFRAVMECGSMTAAAQSLGISQPNVSRLVAQLEAATGLKLFERRSGRLVPTDDGNAFRSEVERSFVGLRQLEHAANDIRFFGRGRLRIATLPALGFGFLPRVIRRFKDSYPDVTISLQLRSSTTVIQWAAAQQCDVGLAANVTDVPGVDAEPFAALKGVCILPEGHRLTELKVIKPHHLEGEPFISHALDDAARRWVDEAFDAAGVERVLALETQYGSTICSMVAEGLGVSVVNPIVVRDFLHRGIVVRRFEPKVLFRSHLLFPQHRPRARLTEKFVAAMREAYQIEAAGMRRLSS